MRAFVAGRQREYRDYADAPAQFMSENQFRRVSLRACMWGTHTCVHACMCVRVHVRHISCARHPGGACVAITWLAPLPV